MKIPLLKTIKVLRDEPIGERVVMFILDANGTGHRLSKARVALKANTPHILEFNSPSRNNLLTNLNYFCYFYGVKELFCGCPFTLIENKYNMTPANYKKYSARFIAAFLLYDAEPKYLNEYAEIWI